MIGIFVDDERNPEDVTWIKYPDDIQWVMIRKYEDFLHIVRRHLMFYTPFVVSFDHDLQDFVGDKERTGLYYLKSMCNEIESMNMQTSYDISCFFHTQNPIGHENMVSYWNNWQNSIGYY